MPKRVQTSGQLTLLDATARAAAAAHRDLAVARPYSVRGHVQPRGNARPRVPWLRPVQARQAAPRQRDAVPGLDGGRQVGVHLVELGHGLVARLHPTQRRTVNQTAIWACTTAGSCTLHTRSPMVVA